MFTVERSGFLSRFSDVVDPAHRIALIADTDELDTSHSYLVLLGRLHGINVRHFRDEPSALDWIKESALNGAARHTHA
jgi:hypothetical protein